MSSSQQLATMLHLAARHRSNFSNLVVSALHTAASSSGTLLEGEAAIVDTDEERRLVSLSGSAASSSKQGSHGSSEEMTKNRLTLQSNPFVSQMLLRQADGTILTQQAVQSLCSSLKVEESYTGEGRKENRGRFEKGESFFIDPEGISGLYTLLLILGSSQWVSSAVQAEDTPSRSAKGLQSFDTEEDLEVQNLRPIGETKTNSHTARWRIYTDKGRDLFAQGRLEESETYLKQALEHARLGFGEQDQHVASSLQNLAELYRIQGDFARAEPLYLTAIEQLKATVGPDDFTVGQAMHNLAGCYLVQRNFNKAREYYEGALAIKGKAVGAGHPEYANTQFHLGEVLRLQGRHDDAAALMRGAIKILEEGGAAHTSSVIKKMGRLAEILVDRGELGEAEKLQRKVLHAVDMVQGAKSANHAAALENLAATLLAAGRFAEATELLQSALATRWEVDKASPAVGRTLSKLAEVSERAARARKNDAAAARAPEEAAVAEQEATQHYKAAADLLERAVRIAEQSWEKAGSALQAALRAVAAAKAKGLGVQDAEAQLRKAQTVMLPRLLELAGALASFGRVNLALAAFRASIQSEDRLTMELTGETSVRRALEFLTVRGPGIPGLAKPLDDVAVQENVRELLEALIGVCRRKRERARTTQVLDDEISQLVGRLENVKARIKEAKKGEQRLSAQQQPPGTRTGWRGWIKLWF